jgi:hypothetical protein
MRENQFLQKYSYACLNFFIILVFLFFSLNEVNAQFSNYERLRLSMIDSLIKKSPIDLNLKFKERKNDRFSCALFTTLEVEKICLFRTDFQTLLVTISNHDHLTENYKGLRRYDGLNDFDGSCDYEFSNPYDTLNRFLNNQIEKNIRIILDSIQNASLTIEEKDFLSYFTYFTLHQMDLLLCEYQSIAFQLSREFLKNYPNSEYSTFINKHSSCITETSNIGFGLILGVGYNFNSASIKNNFKQMPHFEIGGSLNIHRFNINLTFFLSQVRTKNDIYLHPVLFTENRPFHAFQFNSSVGYKFYLGKKLNLTPFIGSMRYSFQGELNEDEYEQFQTITSISFFSFQKGILLEYDIDNRFTCDYFNDRKTKLKDYSFSVFLKASYSNTNYSRFGFDFTGNVTAITFGISTVLQDRNCKLVEY